MNDVFMIDENESRERSAAEIFKSSVGLTVRDGVLSVVFSTVENRKGYGKQYIPVADLESTLAVLQNARQNGIQSESEEKTTSQIVRESIVESEYGEIRFKTENSKGKKPTVFSSTEDFSGFVSEFEGYVPKIIAKANSIKDKLS